MSRSWTPRELYYVDKIITLINNRTYEEGGGKLIMARQRIKYKLQDDI